MEGVALQRGRAFEGAEMRHLADRLAHPEQLQRGRAFEGAEMELVSAFHWSAMSLQRGRAFEGAEIGLVFYWLVPEVIASTGPRF